ncbi:MAG: hypothetical protein DHS20C02_20430 [Micavibrio sp.]|nr:MAG: hypothetical protein DHS20C02_20430 [Micavibrio sp.]
MPNDLPHKSFRFASSENYCETPQAAEDRPYWYLSDLYDGQCGTGDVYADVFTRSLDIIATSPSGRLMLKEAMAQDWQIGFDEFSGDLSGEDFYIDVQEKQIFLDNNALAPESLFASPYFSNAVVLCTIRALRQVWQEKRHGGFDEDYGPESILMLERVRVADCHVMAVLVAWELRGEGHNGLWRHLIGSEAGDMAMAFSKHLERDPGSMFAGGALASAFYQWYLCEERINECDHNTLEYMDMVMSETSQQNPFGRKTMARLDVEILSCLPDKTAYLQGQGDNILRDPRYAGLTDPINQTHLFHIMRDLETVIAGGVPFRDAGLAAKMFPEEDKDITTRI